MIKKLLVVLLSLFLLISCEKEKYDGIYQYIVQIESPYTQLFLIEHINPNFPDVIFSDIITHKSGISVWEFKDQYKDGDYLEIYIESLDKYQPLIINVDIKIHGNYVAGGTGNGFQPIKIIY